MIDSVPLLHEFYLQFSAAWRQEYKINFNY